MSLGGRWERERQPRSLPSAENNARGKDVRRLRALIRGHGRDPWCLGHPSVVISITGTRSGAVAARAPLIAEDFLKKWITHTSIAFCQDNDKPFWNYSLRLWVSHVGCHASHREGKMPRDILTVWGWIGRDSPIPAEWDSFLKGGTAPNVLTVPILFMASMHL